MKSRKILSLLLAMLLLSAMAPMAFAADDAAPAAASASVESDSTQAKDAAASVEGDTAATDETAPAEGDEAAKDETAPADGDKTAKDETASAEGDEAAKDETAPAEDDEAAKDETAPADDASASEKSEAADNTQVIVPIVVKKDAKLSASSVLVDGKAVAFDAYTIDGYTYFKLRDIAAAVTSTDAAFNVSWNAEAFCIELTTGASYEKAEGDLVAGAGKASVIASSTQMPILLDGEKVELAGYSIGGNTYFQLRDLGEKLGFSVSWNAEAKSIDIETKKNDPAEKPADAPADAEKPADAPADEEKPADASADEEKPADASADEEKPADASADEEKPADASADEEKPADASADAEKLADASAEGTDDSANK